ncbi:hypothetical protein [Haliangium ochraceum]|uniref:hypothetical protein n=1 Tax=Haliangium ochraceum TaxID=80816 RepID=UPI001E310B6E|nr:hypothetical protein [Haliangium ochraceum]
MGGGLVLEDGPNEFRAWLAEIGPSWIDVFPREEDPTPEYILFGGRWNSSERDEGRRIIVNVACLLFPEESTSACQREIWTSSQYELGNLETQTTLSLRSSCPDGAKLVGGGCSTEAVGSYRYVQVIQSGFAQDDPDAWLCSWANTSDDEQTQAMAMAYCLHEEPLPAECGCCPTMAETITVKREDEPLRFGPNRLEVSCDEGQTLVLGNCTLDVDDITPFRDVTMFRSGFPPTEEHPDGDRSRWGCSWYNPTGMAPRAIATAVCLPAE